MNGFTAAIAAVCAIVGVGSGSCVAGAAAGMILSDAFAATDCLFFRLKPTCCCEAGACVRLSYRLAEPSCELRTALDGAAVE